MFYFWLQQAMILFWNFFCDFEILILTWIFDLDFKFEYGFKTFIRFWNINFVLKLLINF